MRLVERDTELGVLRRLFADCERHRGRVVVLSGAVASGKSELLHTFTEHAQERGALVLSASCAEEEQGLPLGVVEQLLRQAALSSASEAKVSGLLAESAALAESADPPCWSPKHQAKIVSGLGSELLDLASGGPVLISVDDIQHADGLSLQCLLHVVRRVKSTKMVLALTESARPQASHPLFHAELLRHPYCRRVRLSPLTRGGVTELLGEYFTEPASPQLACQYHAVSGGNPLLVHALVEDRLTATASRDSDVVIADAFELAVVTILHRCNPEVLEVARAFAVLGDAATPALVSRLLGIETEVVTQAVHVLSTAGLVHAGDFRHPAIRAAVLTTIAPEDRAALHGRLARIRHEQGAPSTAVARHLIAAGLADELWAVDLLEEAAEVALGEDDVKLAVDCLELAHEGCPDEHRRATIRMTLVSVVWDVNPSTVTSHLEALVSAFRAGILERRYTGRLIRLLLWNGRTSDAVEILGHLVGGENPGDAAEFATTYEWLRCTHPALAARMSAGGTESPRPQPPRAAPGEHFQAVSAFATVLKGEADERTLDRAERVLKGARVMDSTPDPVVWSLLALVYADRVEKAAPFCDEYLRQAEARNSAVAQGKLSAVRATIALRRGDMPEAERFGRAALTQLPARGWGVAIGLPLSLLLRTATARGKYDDAAKLLKQAVPDAMFESRYGVHYLHARGHFYLATDYLEAAARDFEACGEQMANWGIDVPALVPWRGDLAEVHLRWGNPDRAIELVTRQLDLAGPRRPRARGISLRILAATSELPQRASYLREAVELLQSAGDRYELAKALGDLSSALHLLGESNRARLVARRAWRAANECRAEPLLRSLAPDTDTADAEEGTVTDLRALSEAERRVGALATLGYSNREIARKLYITVSTVEQHLTRVYRKLDVQRRADLPVSLQLAVADTA